MGPTKIFVENVVKMLVKMVENHCFNSGLKIDE